jgi:hypothetical protein
MRLLKLIVKYFFYPRMIIADPKYNFMCFMLFLGSLWLIKDLWTPWYIGAWLAYLIIGQSLPKSWLKEFYDIDGIG